MNIAIERLAELRMAAEVGLRMAGLQPHTVHVKPDELAALVEEVFIARAQERPSADVACRICGCTDNDCSKCIEKTGHPCTWAEPDLCSACVGWSVQSVARDLAVKLEVPGVLLMLYDEQGALHLGCTAVDHPIAAPFHVLAHSINIACERGITGFHGVSREKAVEIAQHAAKAKPQSYYAEPFVPHEWVVDAIVEASSALPPIPAQCLHCGHAIERETAREHLMSCAKSPLVQELEKLRAIIATHLPHPNGPDATVPGDPDAWNAAMFNLGKMRDERDKLRAELAEHYPVAITARAMMNDEASLADLREVSDRIGNSTLAARLEYLPARLRGGA